MFDEFLDMWRNHTSRRVKSFAYSLIAALGISVFFNGYYAAVSSGKTSEIARLNSKVGGMESKIESIEKILKNKTYTLRDDNIVRGSIEDLAKEETTFVDPRVLARIFDYKSPDCGDSLMNSLSRVKGGIGTYGAPRDNGKRRHMGIDIPKKFADEVCAVSDGIVVFAGSINGGHGNTTILDNYGYCTLYAHNYFIPVGISKDKKVKRGEVIAFAGESGNSGLSIDPRYNYLHAHVEFLPKQDCENLLLRLSADWDDPVIKEMAVRRVNPMYALNPRTKDFVIDALENFHGVNKYDLTNKLYDPSLAGMGLGAEK